MNNQLSPFERRRADTQRAAQRRRERMRRRFRAILITFMVIIVAVTAITLAITLVNWDSVFGKEERPFTPTADGNLLYGPELSYYDPLEATTDYVEIPRERLYSGPCILVNRSYEFHFEYAEEPVSVYQYKSSSYSARTSSVLLNREMIVAMNRMFDAFGQQADIYDLMVNSAYRSYEEQAQIYEEYLQDRGEEYTKKYVSDPGFSEHHSGLAADIATYNYRGISALRNEGAYAWVYDNMAEYGFILRYPLGKEAITGISYESWHLRYVTVPHALLIARQGYCLEEYMDYIRIYTYDGAHANVTSKAGASYDIYFVPATDDAIQVIPVPKNSQYEIYGNNCTGFLVSVTVSSDTQDTADEG